MKLTRDLFAIANKFLLNIDIDLWANMRTIGAARAALVKFIIFFFVQFEKVFVTCVNTSSSIYTRQSHKNLVSKVVL